MRVRPATERDTAAARELVVSNWANDPVFSSQADHVLLGAAGAAVVATDAAGRLIGVATVGPAGRHAHRAITVDVAPEARNAGVGRSLVGALRQHSDGTPLFSRLRPWDTAARGFFSSLGFETVETAVSCTVDPRTPDVDAWVQAMLDDPPDGVTADVGGEAVAGEAAVLLARWYERTHRWSPPRPFDVDEARARFVDGALDTSLVVVRRHGVIVAAGTLLPDPFEAEPDLAHLAYAGCAIQRPDDAGLVTIVYAACLRRAAALDRRVRFEVSSNHVAGWTAVHASPLSPEPELILVAEPLQ